MRTAITFLLLWLTSCSMENFADFFRETILKKRLQTPNSGLSKQRSLFKKLCRNRAFPQNFHSRKSGEITVLCSEAHTFTEAKFRENESFDYRNY